MRRCLLGREARRDVGRYGEAAAAAYLRQRCAERGAAGTAVVEWINEEREMGDPYDILVKVKTGQIMVR